MFRRAISFPYLVLFLAPFVLFSPILFTGKALFWGIPSTQFIPWWQTAWETVSQGHLPLWNPWLGMGAPLLANYQSALLYPPTWSYFLLWLAGGTPVMAWGMALLVSVHLVWAGLGMALLVRRIGLGIFSQLISGLAYGLSGYLVARAGFLSINVASAWTPWVILGATWLVDELVKSEIEHIPQTTGDGQFKRKRFGSVMRAGLFLGVCTGLQLLSGHAQSAWYSLVLAGIWTLFWVYFAHRRSIGSNPTIRFVFKCTFYFLGTMFIGVVLSAAQLLPTTEYLLQSQRSSAVDFDFAMAYSFWPWHWLTLLAPGLFGNPASGDYWGYANFWEDAIYIGLIPFFLALTAIFGRQRRSKLVIFLLTLTLIASLLSLGKNTPIFPWLYQHIPTFDMFQAPTRINLLVIFSLAILAGIGAKGWHRPTGRALYWTRLGTMAAAAVTIGAFLAGLVAQQVFGEIEPSFIRATALAGTWGIVLGVLTLKAPQDTDNLFALRKSALWAWAVILLVAADLVIAGWGLNPGIDLDFYSQSPRTAKSVQMMAGDGRLFLPVQDEKVLKFEWLFRYDTFDPFPPNIGWEYLRSALLPNLSSLDHIATANNFDPLLPGRYATWMDVLNEANSENLNNLLNLMAVSVVEDVNKAQPYEVGFDPRPTLPRARWVPCGVAVQDGQQALAAILQADESQSNVVWLETTSTPIYTDCNPDQIANVELSILHPGEKVMDIESDSPGYLVLADVWYPGWRALLDGQPTTIWKANYLFQAVEIPRGKHHLVLAYQPVWFQVGLAISILAWIGVAVLAIYSKRFST